ncbi:MAG: GIY-YIG nuclease family protein [Cyanobacteria bacterium J06641_5]
MRYIWGHALGAAVGQLELFDRKFLAPRSRDLFDGDALKDWKAKIVACQQRERLTSPPQQQALFDLAAVADPVAIDPFSLRLYSSLFYRFSLEGKGRPCLYFVLDRAASLLLYVGETCQVNQRWRGIHDCKRYIENYLQLHRELGIEASLATAFYWQVPTATRARQALERRLIYRWRSPFNKENWLYWGHPFR